MKEIKVMLHTENNGMCEQVFKVIDKNEFYIRTSDFVWYTATDYGERDFMVQDDIVFIICDPMGNDIFSTSINPDFRFLKDTCKLEWEKIRKDYKKASDENSSNEFWIHTLTGDTNSELNKWLLSFKDPDIYGKKAIDYDENWTDFNYEVLSKEILHRFNYCGMEQHITCIQKKHSICHVTWKEYYSGGHYMAAEFDYKKTGTMYAVREAKQLIKKTLKEVYGDVAILSMVDSIAPHYEYRVTIEYAAEKLLKGNYKKKYVNELIQNEQKQRHYYTNKAEIEAVYGQDYIPYFFHS